MSGIFAWLHMQLQNVMAVVASVTTNHPMPAKTVLAAQADVLAALLVVYGVSKITKAVKK